MADDERPVCERCGRVHARCTAHTRAGLPCGQRAVPGGTVCRFHGGAAPQVRERAEARLMEARVTQALTSYGVPLEERHPIDVLLEQVWTSSAAARFYGRLVSELAIPDPAGGPFADVVGMDDDGEPVLAQAIGSLYGRDHNRELAPHVLVSLWNHERERAARFAKMALDAGVAERMVRLAEGQGQQIVSIVMAVLDHPDLGLDEDRRAAGRKVAADQLRALAA